ncbi:MAG: hypothetical protein O7E52_11430 [Candidatus Poribacteria bacterium]|nr:hypothetical protein [Candidatus Poribacteria bacterium]
MSQFSVRVNDELYEKALEKAQEADVSLSDFVRDVVMQACDNGSVNRVEPAGTLDILRDELTTKNRQIDHLTQELVESRRFAEESSKRHDTIVMQLSQ